jgi:modulator of FtsH protease HflK
MSESPKTPLTAGPSGIRPSPAPLGQVHLPEGEDAGSRALSEALSSSFFFVKLLMAILVISFLVSCFVTVKQNEVAVILRFGKPSGGLGGERLLKPGLHFAWPYPIDEVVPIRVGESHTVTSSVGWYATTPEAEAAGMEPPLKGFLAPGVDGYTLTADGNIIHVKATLKYRISDPWRYAFYFANASNLVQNILDNALFYASAHFTADAALYKDFSSFHEAIRERVNQGIAVYQLGITLEPGDVRVSAPLDVRAKFEEVQSAEQERSKNINQAEASANEIVLRAVGEAKARISDGLTASNQMVVAVMADVTYFQDQLPYYQRNPGLFKKRLLTDSLETVMTNVPDKFFLPERADGQKRELRLQLNREPRSPKPSNPGQP